MIVRTQSWRRGTVLTLALLMLATSLTGVPVDAAGPKITVTPTEHFDQVQTPGVGFQDFVGARPTPWMLTTCRLEGNELSAPDTAGLEGGSIYVRLLWRDIEPTEDNYDWAMLDRIFECAEQQNKTVDLRVMLSFPADGDKDCIDGGTEDDTVAHGVPCWLVRKGVNEFLYTGPIAADNYLPDWEDPILRRHHARLIAALGQRYRNNPRLSSVDVGSAGLWGEWHTYPHPEFMPSNQRAIEIIDLYARVFPRTPLVILAQVFVNDAAGDSAVADHLRANHAGRYGWRGDSWGNLGHHRDAYGPIDSRNPNLWRTGPIAMEVTGVMNQWPGWMNHPNDYTRTLPLGQTIDAALDWHSSLAHNKASGIPAGYRDDLREMATEMGPRLVLNRLTYDSILTAGNGTAIVTRWHNRGVAPLYRDFRIAYRFRNSSGAEHIVTTSTSMEGLLPTTGSPVTFRSGVRVPAALGAGTWTLDVGIVHPTDSTLRIPIAIDNANSSTADHHRDWYEMGQVTIRSNGAGSQTVERLTAMAPVVPVQTANRLRIVDNNQNSGWDNAGDPTSGWFELRLPTPELITRIRYQDDWNRHLRITVDGVEIFSDWTQNGGEDTWSVIVPDAAVTGRIIRFSLLSGDWLAPEEVQLFTTPS